MKKKIFLITIFIIYIIGLIIMFYHHENWRDEAQAYLLCRDMNLFQLFKNVHYEGHPIFYYLFLYPLVKLGVGPKSVNILSIIFMSISVFLILLKSKLNLIQKVSFIITYPILYEFGIIGRSYSLLFLLLTIYGLLYPNKTKHPIAFSIILGLILNTHLLMVGFVGINTILFYINEIVKHKKKTNKGIIIGLFMIIIFSLLLLFQFYPYLLNNNGMSISNSKNAIKYITIFFMILYEGILLPNIIITIPSIITFSIIYTYIYKNDKNLFLILMISYLFISFLSTYIFDGIAIYTLSLAFSLLLIILLIMKVNNDKKIMISIVIIGLLSFYSSYKAYYLDYNNNYSSSLETAKYINNNISNKSTFICNTDSLCTSIIPYVDNKFYSTKTNKTFTYIVWNKDREKKVNIKKIYNYIDNNTSLYYIVSYFHYDEDIKILNQLKTKYSIKKEYTSVKPTVDNKESYIIYKIK